MLKECLMRGLAVAPILGVIACSSESSVGDGGDAAITEDASITMDATTQADTSKPDTSVQDTGSNEASAEAGDDAEVDAGPPDSGLPPEGSDCTNEANQIQEQPCGLCGKQYRACLPAGDGGYVWGGWGFCQGEVKNGCDPNKNYPDLTCGNCGVLKQVCLQNCTFDLTQQCQEPMNACSPGASEFKLGLSCDGGGRERSCDNNCQWTPWGSCSSGITPLLNRMAGGFYHTCAINNNGQLKCWGDNSYGQLGNGSFTTSNTPVNVSNITNVKSLGAGYEHTCAVDGNNNPFCWGYNVYGMVGDGTTTSRTVPTAVSNLAGQALSIDAAYYHSCAVLANGTARCWGYNIYGQLGNGSTTTSNLPVTVSNLSNALQMDTGLYYHSCALVQGGDVQCWGYNTYGQVGDGTTTNRNTPVSTKLSNVVQLGAGYFHTCAVYNDNSLTCWGYNTYGQLGDGTTTTSNVPKATNVIDAVQVAAGLYHTCYLSIGGEVKCVGYNVYGQLGDGTTTSKSSWVTPINGGARAVTAGAYHTCALMSDGKTKCWGYNVYGQLGNGNTTNQNKPVDVVNF